MKYLQYHCNNYYCILYNVHMAFVRNTPRAKNHHFT